MSAPKDELGRYQIDPAELFRVYPPTRSETEGETDTDPKGDHAETALFRHKAGLLEQIIENLREERERERQQLQATINDLRGRLDKEAEERRRLTLLITDQRPDRDDDPRRSSPLTFWLAATAAALGLGLAAWRLWYEGKP